MIVNKGCVRLASLDQPRCVAVFFFRTNVGNYLHTFVLKSCSVSLCLHTSLTTVEERVINKHGDAQRDKSALTRIANTIQKSHLSQSIKQAHRLHYLNRTEPNQTEPKRTERNGTEPKRTEPNRTEPNRTESNRIESIRLMFLLKL